MAPQRCVIRAGRAVIARLAPALLAGLVLTMGAGPVLAQPLRVGSESAHRTIASALAAAAAGDTVVVAPGTYRESILVDRAVTLVGEGWPVIDAGGRGHVIEALAPVEVRGFVVRGSGTSVDEEHAGVMVRKAQARIVGNRFEDVLYGVYLKEAPGSFVAGNRIAGKPFVPPRRGDGIRLWYSTGTTIENNRLVRVRDLVVYFSDSVAMRGNRIEDSRYGLHTMYSNHGRLADNELVGNQVGAFVMYSRDVRIEGNAFVRAAGASGMGLGLKDSDAVVVEASLFLDNAIGVHLDNSPRERDARNRFEGNAFVGNEAAVRLLPSVRDNAFAGNDFVSNGTPALLAGGASREVATRNEWRGNHWAGYAGFDRDHDGTGDTPYVHARLADALLGRYPALRLFAGSPALEAVDLIARFLPLLRPSPLVVDTVPRMAPMALGAWRDEAARFGGTNPSPAARLAGSAMWLAGAATVGGLLWLGARGRA